MGGTRSLLWSLVIFYDLFCLCDVVYDWNARSVHQKILFMRVLVVYELVEERIGTPASMATVWTAAPCCYIIGVAVLKVLSIHVIQFNKMF